MEADIMDYLSQEDVDTLSPGILAYVGDAVYEVYVRKHLLKNKLVDKDQSIDLDALHKEAVLRVCATAQAQALTDLESSLLPDEACVARRARNIKIGRGPRSMPVLDYRHSTGFEAVIGYLYLTGKSSRLKEVLLEALNAIEFRIKQSQFEPELNKNGKK